jgi:hypothetical protein
MLDRTGRREHGGDVSRPCALANEVGNRAPGAQMSATKSPSTPGMIAVFWIWTALIAVGLAVMIAVPAMGR